MSYYTKITKAGLAAITAAMNNNSKVPITYMAFGDGNGYIPEPDENATSLVNEVYRVGVNKVEVHNKNPNWLVCEAIIPSAVGGFNIREVALYDSTGNTMLAIASYPPTYKPTVEEGAAKIQTIRIVIQVDNSGNFELLIDPDVVLATAQFVDDKTKLKRGKVHNLVSDLLKESTSTKQYGSIGNAEHRPVSEWTIIGVYPYYPNLQAMQVDYPFVTSLNDSIDWATTQKAINETQTFGTIEINGCLHINKPLTLKTGQQLIGKNSNWFINTNSGITFVNPLSGSFPKFGIYYSGSEGHALDCPEAVQLSGFHLFGKGYKTPNVNILTPSNTEIYDTVGIRIQKFIHANDLSVFYFKKAFNSVGGNYYSRFNLVEVTRCNKGFCYEVDNFAQEFHGCCIRTTDVPFEFASKARSFKFFGGSIEGYKAKDADIVLLPAHTDVTFLGTYFETYYTDFTSNSLFKANGENVLFNMKDGCVYMSNLKAFFDPNQQKNVTVNSNGNTFIANANAPVKSPIAYKITTDDRSLFNLSGDRIASSDINQSLTGSIASNSNVLDVDTTNIVEGQKIIVKGATVSGDLTAVVKTINSATQLVLSRKASKTASNAIVEVYNHVQYVPIINGLNLLYQNIQFPKGSFPLFDYLKFEANSAFAMPAISEAPHEPFNGLNKGLAIYLADGLTWNPCNRASGKPYLVSFTSGVWTPIVGSLSGKLTIKAASTEITILNTSVKENSKVFLQARNASAAGLRVYAEYISNGFKVVSLDAVATDAIFDYQIED